MSYESDSRIDPARKESSSVKQSICWNSLESSDFLFFRWNLKTVDQVNSAIRL